MTYYVYIYSLQYRERAVVNNILFVLFVIYLIDNNLYL